ncbi:hypothetical protein SAMN05421837_103832 [Amycolatopsis pretoriensis]|uniref:Uncharacterized protein n=1 Tax=Amycolatopsis pretoriensis TaxID=218821 RepID=A0A1H5QNK4_9PSEU|nr:hypothetical protein [Amycolatopsis pretoriensis]SEF27424.1 hypothetical protein SAMN05421837_103832 [Amycolatopsis pretoriensis]
MSAAALRWLASRGQRVRAPAPFIDALLATRDLSGRSLVWLLVFGVPVFLGGVFYLDFFGATVSALVYLVCLAILLAGWQSIRSAQRQLARRTRPWPGPASRPGGWFVAAGALAYGGGAAIAVSLLPTAPAFATGRLILLGVFASCGVVIVTSFLRAPVLAVDDASAAVYRGLVAENLHAASPALVAVPPLLDLVTESPVPRGYAPVLVAYAVVVIAAELVAYLRGRRPLPAGHYGDPLPRGTAVDWSPPEAR